jgi:hypothetical protein
MIARSAPRIQPSIKKFDRTNYFAEDSTIRTRVLLWTDSQEEKQIPILHHDRVEKNELILLADG